MVPINATSCEGLLAGGRRRSLLPTGAHPLEPFPIDDPFGLRRAVVPVFLASANQPLLGMGTAFHVDGLGTFLTADHVIADLRANALLTERDVGDRSIDLQPDDLRAVVLLSVGVVFGTVAFPEEALAWVRRTTVPVVEKEDPMAELRGETSVSALDIAAIHVTEALPANRNASLPVRLRGWRPQVGDLVIAVGFPELDCKPTSESDLQLLLEEGMYAAHGHTTTAHPLGRDRSNPTPVFEVEAN